MANEKTLNTRIGLKYDSLTNWTSSSLVLKRGEIAFATTAASVGNGLTEPVIMAKIGDGSKTFAQLDWSFYAKASDVYPWAKQDQASFENYLKTFIGETIEDTNDNTTYAFAIVDGKLQVTETPHSLGQAGEPIVTSYDFITPEELENTLGTLSAEFKKEEAGADGLVYNLKQTNGKITSFDASIAANTYDAYGSAATAKSEAITAAAEDATTKANAAQAAAERKVTELANGQVNTNKDAIADIVDGTTPVAKATNADKLGDVVAADYALKTYADQAEADAVATAKAYTDEMKNSILGEGISETFDTLKEIQNWIEGAGVNATELTEAIAAEAKAREDGDALKVDKTTYETYIAGKSLSDEELKADAQGYATTAEQNAKAYADALTEIGDESATVSAAGEAVNISSNMSVAISSNGILNISCGSQNIDFAGDGSSITVTGDMQVQEPINNSSVSTKKYVDDALAAAKEYADNNDADTLYQAGEGLALNVDAKGNNVFSIDDSLTWIFDCGTSAN